MVVLIKITLVKLNKLYGFILYIIKYYNYYIEFILFYAKLTKYRTHKAIQQKLIECPKA